MLGVAFGIEKLYGFHKNVCTVPTGNVIRQNPAGGSSQKKGVTITVEVSLGANNAIPESYFTYSVANGKATITDFNNNYAGDVIIPETLGGYPVTGIGENAFKDYPDLTGK